MHNNAFILKRYGDFLRDHIKGSSLCECVSTSLTDIHLLFSNDVYLSIKFYKQHSFFLLPDASNFPKKNVLPQFKSVVGKEVTDVRGYVNDRGIQLSFSNYSLDIQCFGRRSGILFSKDNFVLEHFKTVQPPTQIERLPRDIIFSRSSDDFQKQNPFITKEIIDELASKNFFESSNQGVVWSTYINSFQTQKLHIVKRDNELPKLTVFAEQDILETYANIGTAFHDFAKLYMANDRFETLQSKLLVGFRKELKKQNNRLKKLKSHYTKLTQGQNLKEIGDIIMANLYNIPDKSTSVTLFNFYSNQDIEITLKENLSPQKNAERYYQKSKNIHVEVAHTEKLIKAVLNSIEALENQIDFVMNAQSYRDIQKLDKSINKEEVATTAAKQLPYREFEYKGYDIWVGKSAKNNDDLLKKTHKTDIWFHARGVAGSHVLLKNPSGEKIPEDVLEYAASLAAKFSKNQHDTLAAVIYTEPKYVRKFKGALPGQVRVDREEVILVKPFDRR